MIFILVFTGEGDSMKIAVLSGKGGTGKTLISVNMAAVRQKSVYIDCDVEEPNGHLFFKPVDVRSEKVSVKIPVADDNLCNGCRKCVDFCKYNALVYVNDRLMVFEDICHSCGGCVLLCPERALSERDQVIGEVRRCFGKHYNYQRGTEYWRSSGTPIIKELISRISREERPVIIDCPPGSACIVMESIKDADYCILVSEPTLFGVHNLDMVCELVRLFDKPYGVIVNKCMDGENPAEEYCVKNGIRILGKIPYDEELGRLNSNGLIAAWVEKEVPSCLSLCIRKVAGRCRHEALLILSGKGGTGKTTIASAFIKLLNAKVYADCDVDAPNLPGYESVNRSKHGLHGLPKAEINGYACNVVCAVIAVLTPFR